MAPDFNWKHEWFCQSIVEVEAAIPYCQAALHPPEGAKFLYDQAQAKDHPNHGPSASQPSRVPGPGWPP